MRAWLEPLEPKTRAEEDAGTPSATPPRVPIDESGLLVGRERSCDVILKGPWASRFTAIVRMGLKGPELLPFGMNPVQVGMREVSEPTPLKSDDVLGFGAKDMAATKAPSDPPALERFRVVSIDEDADAPRSWTIQVGLGGPVFGVRRRPFEIGGDGSDLVLPGCSLTVAQLWTIGAEVSTRLRQEVHGAERDVPPLRSGGRRRAAAHARRDQPLLPRSAP